MAYINQYLLSDPRLYKEMITQVSDLLNVKQLEINSDKIKHITYASWQQRHYFWPDQVFHGHWKNFEERKKKDSLWSLALLGQAARFHFDTDTRRLAIQSIKFDSWQSWISKQSGLPVIAYQLNKMFDKSSFENDSALANALKSQLGFRAIVAPHHPLIEDYIENCGLHETHMHLNGTTLLEQLWHHALQNPDLILDHLEKEHNNERVKLLYASNLYLSEPREYYKLLKLARKLRELLLTWLYQDNTAIDEAKENLCQNLLNDDSQNYFRNENIHFDKVKHWSHISELHWQVKLQIKLKEYDGKNDLFDSCYLLYILSMNCYQRLLVQGNDQYGFDQFQKFADDGVREEIETEYKSRFFQLHGPNVLGKADLATLEARFAPKKTLDKNVKLISDILIGFLDYAKGDIKLNQSADLEDLAIEVLKINRPKLRLIAHFIKQKWTVADGGYYYQSLREKLLANGSQLIELLRSNTTLKQVITGIDAAANELEAPPEVFGPFYRYCKVNGIKNFTYHVGEDFEHLVSGVRAVFDAVNFLDLKNGDRLGHATAIGICPTLWLSAMPEKIFIKSFEWLDNLLFIRKIALSNAEVDFPILKLEEDILKILEKLDLGSNINIAQITFDMRGLEPIVVDSYLSGDTNSLTGWLNLELKTTSNHSKASLEFLHKRWFNNNCLVKGEELIEVQLSDTSVKLIIQLQQSVQKIISERHVVIESLPTSNVRISHYKSINEHHIFRWLGLEGRSIEGDSNMLITLGSDDPGIFATDMRNEVYHIFSTLRHEFNLDPHAALSYIRRLNKNGRIYHFNYEDDTIVERSGYAD
jgi:hypothetical protein